MKIRWGLAVLLFGLGGVAYSDEVVSNLEQDGPSDPTKILVLSPEKGSLRLYVKANSSTGYMWVIKGYDPQLLKLKKHFFLRQDAKSKTGSPNLECFEFVPTKGLVGNFLTEIKLAYLRVFEPYGQKNETIFRVVIYAD